MTDRDLMQRAVEALGHLQGLCTDAEDGFVEAVTIWTPDIIDDLNERLAQPEQEPVAYLCENAVGHKYFRWKKPSSTYKPIAVYTTLPQRKPLPKSEWPKHPSPYVNDQYMGYSKSDLNDYAMQVLEIHGIKE